MPRLLVGLGNPGPRYEGTRHNVGFEAVDRIVEHFGGKWYRQERATIRGEAEIEGRTAVLLKPMTFMNLSGGPVAEWTGACSLERSEVLVYLDDVALPLGRIRIRERGSDGGHRGLASVLEALGGIDVPRVRIGIQPEEPAASGELADYVLAPFSSAERKRLDVVLERVVEATRMIFSGGIGKAMSSFNSALGPDKEK